MLIVDVMTISDRFATSFVLIWSRFGLKPWKVGV
jgi:hypothetical protein